MVMDRQDSRGSRSEERSVDVRALEGELARRAAKSETLLENIPSLTQIVVTTDRKSQEAFRRSLATCHEALTAEQSAFRALQERAPSAPKGSRELEQRRDYVRDLRSRAEDLFLPDNRFPAQVPITSNAQTAELIEGLHHYRQLFWRKLYEVPGVQRVALEKLRQVATGDIQPSSVIHSSSAGKPNEHKLLKLAKEVVSEVDALMAKRLRESSKSEQRAEIGAILLRAPLDPGELSTRHLTLRDQANRPADIEIALKCEYRSIRTEVAKKDPRFREWQELAADFGGGALVARTTVAELSKAQEPYVRIKQYLTTSNFPFVRNLISRRRRFQSLAADMMQEGAIGFMRALDKFDPKSGFSLLTYAGFWVDQRAARGFEQQAGLIYVPGRLRGSLARLSEESFQDTQRNPEALAKKIGVKERELLALIPLTHRMASLDVTIKGTDVMLGDAVSDRGLQQAKVTDSPLDQASYKERIIAALGTLSPRDRQILILRFGLDGKGERTLLQVAKEMKVTLERIRQLQSRALEFLKHGAAGRELERLAEELES